MVGGRQVRQEIRAAARPLHELGSVLDGAQVRGVPADLCDAILFEAEVSPI